MPKLTTPEWRNRIVGHGDEAPDQLLANPKNWRTHPANQREALRGALDQVGWVQQVMVNRITGHIVDGHARVEEALTRGEATVPVLYVELEPHEEDVVLATLDPIGALATRDDERLRMLLAEVEFDAQALREMTNDLMPKEAKVGLTDPDAVPDPGDDMGIKRGDLFALGDHRLLCGDSTNADDVARVMDGQHADITFTSPPYNVGRTPNGDAQKYLNDSDARSDESYVALLRDSLARSLDVSDYAFVNVQSVAGNKRALIEWLYLNRDVFADTIVWDKQAAEPAMAKNVLNSRFEYVHVFSHHATRVIGSVEFRGTVDNVVSLPSRTDKDVASVHKATFPVAFAAWFVERFARREQAVFDPFMGSGTTMVAAEQLGRHCYAIDIEPRYVAIAIRRWENFTGRKAVQLG